MSASSHMAPDIGGRVESSSSAVSWAAIFAGGLAAVATTIILLTIGAGAGLASVSPWADHGATAGTVVIGAIIWLVVVQWISSATGGYVAGRLRTNWTGLDRDELFFRDTAHGLLAWAVATILSAVLAVSVVSNIAGAGARGVAAVGQGAATAAAAAVSPVSQYELDALLRPAQPTSPGAASVPDVAPEVMRILANGLTTGEVPEADRAYLARIVAARAEISQEEARQRVDGLINGARAAAERAKEAAEAARKAGMTMALLTALAMLVGAFSAAVAAAFGGSHRDEV